MRTATNEYVQSTDLQRLSLALGDLLLDAEYGASSFQA